MTVILERKSKQNLMMRSLMVLVLVAATGMIGSFLLKAKLLKFGLGEKDCARVKSGR